MLSGPGARRRDGGRRVPWLGRRRAAPPFNFPLMRAPRCRRGRFRANQVERWPDPRGRVACQHAGQPRRATSLDPVWRRERTTRDRAPAAALVSRSRDTVPLLRRGDRMTDLLLDDPGRFRDNWGRLAAIGPPWTSSVWRRTMRSRSRPDTDATRAGPRCNGPTRRTRASARRPRSHGCPSDDNYAEGINVAEQLEIRAPCCASIAGCCACGDAIPALARGDCTLLDVDAPRPPSRTCVRPVGSRASSCST